MNLVDAKLLWRDWRGGQLNLIISSLVLAVTVVTAVSLLADRVERGLDEQISSFLAADLAVQGSVVIPPEYQSQAQQMSLQTANIAQFRSMVFAGDESHLSAVKAVSTDYPLRGLIEVSSLADNQQVEKLQHGPPSGEAWVDARLLALLNTDLGATIEVGYKALKVTRLIVNEPDRGARFTTASARVLMNVEDLAATQLVRPGSQVSYKLLLAGDAAAIQQYQQWFEAQAERDTATAHHRLQNPQDSEQELSDALARGRSFLLLSGTIGVLLAGLAMALAAHRYASRLTDQVALMKAWGQSASAIRQSHLVRLSLITLAATLIGMALGWLAHYFLLGIAKGLLDVQLPSAGWRPWVVAGITGFVCVLGFALPALWHLPSIAPLRVLRRDIPQSLVGRGRRLLIGIVALFSLTFWYSGSLVVSGLFLLALFALFSVCGLVALQILKLVQGFGSWHGSYVRLGLANLWRRRAQTLIQLIGFSATLMLLLVVTGLRTNLIDEWQAQLPSNAPSHFLFNVADSELTAVKTLLNEQQVPANRWYPMVRGRLIGLNGEPLTRERLQQTEGLAREVNFTQTDELPLANEIISGLWFDQASPSPTTQATFSIEQEVAEQLGVKLGDEIEFSIGGIKLTAALSSIRSVDWRNMTPNFYIIFQPGTLDRFSPNWLTSLNVAQPQTDSSSVIKRTPEFVKQIIRNYPTAVAIELGDILQRIRTIISRVTQGLEMILLLVLACGAMVLFAAIGVSYDERLRENAILRTLGSSRKIVLGALTVEYATLGAIAGLIASVGAEIILYFVQTQVLEMSHAFHPDLWIMGITAGVILITALGLLRCREIITVPPLQSLRQIG